MADLVAFALALLPILAFLAMVVETFRVGTGAGDYPATNLLHRAYGA